MLAPSGIFQFAIIERHDLVSSITPCALLIILAATEAIIYLSDTRVENIQVLHFAWLDDYESLFSELRWYMMLDPLLPPPFLVLRFTPLSHECYGPNSKSFWDHGLWLEIFWLFGRIYSWSDYVIGMNSRHDVYVIDFCFGLGNSSCYDCAGP